jgi:hypothetical protein
LSWGVSAIHFAIQADMSTPCMMGSGSVLKRIVVAPKAGHHYRMVEGDALPGAAGPAAAQCILDNGPPWGDPHTGSHTMLTAWLLRLGVQISHRRAYHPQTQGKDERLHRTLHAELLSRYTFCDLPTCQPRFDPWREVYNLERPHEALDLAAPITRYQPSPRPFPDPLPPIEYPASDQVRRVDSSGKISFRNRPWRIGKAFRGHPVGIRPDPFMDGQWQVFFCDFKLTTLDFRIS